MLRVSHVMQTSPVVFEGTETLEPAITALAAAGANCAPIVSDGRLAGMVSEMALLDVFFDPALRGAPVSDVAAPEFRTVEPSTPLGHAAHMFGLTGYDALPVVEGERFAGLLRRCDLLPHALRAEEEAWDPLAGLAGASPAPSPGPGA